MSKLVHDHLVSGAARVVEAPDEVPVDARLDTLRTQVEADRNFELPTSLFAMTVSCYLAFIAITVTAFSTHALIIPAAICAAIIIAGFGVPALWTRLRGNVSEPLSSDKFSRAGIMTHTGRLTPRDATIQVLILPVLIVLWACAVVTIAVLA